jgi:hypothetical protein
MIKTEVKDQGQSDLRFSLSLSYPSTAASQVIRADSAAAATPPLFLFGPPARYFNRRGIRHCQPLRQHQGWKAGRSRVLPAGVRHAHEPIRGIREPLSSH